MDIGLDEVHHMSAKYGRTTTMSIQLKNNECRSWTDIYLLGVFPIALKKELFEEGIENTL